MTLPARFLLSSPWLPTANVIAGVPLCVRVIGIPFGVASFELAGLALVPFGKQVVPAGSPLPPGSTVDLAR